METQTEDGPQISVDSPQIPKDAEEPIDSAEPTANTPSQSSEPETEDQSQQRMTSHTKTDDTSKSEDTLTPRPPSDASPTWNRSRPPSTSSTGEVLSESPRPRSSKSRESSQDSKRRRRKKGSSDVNAHRVTFTVTIATAIPTVEDEAAASESREAKHRKRIVEAPRAQNHFHLEYNLLPDEEENVKTDIVTFGMAAKIYTERQEAKVVKTWTEGGLTWSAWTHAHTVIVTDDLLKKLFRHQVELRVWDTRDKLSTRARYDRPKAFKLPTAKPGEDADGAGGVKALVLKQCVNYKAEQPKICYINRPLPSPTRPTSRADDVTEGYQGYSQDAVQTNLPTSKQQPIPERLSTRPSGTKGRGVPASSSPTPATLVQIPAPKPATGDKLRSYSRLGKLAGVAPPTEPPPDQKAGPRSRVSQSVTPKTQAKSRQSSQPQVAPHTASTPDTIDKGFQDTGTKPHGEEGNHGSTTSHPRTPAKHESGSRPKKNKRLEAAAQAEADQIKKHGMCCVPVQMAKLFAGMETITERLEKSVNGLEDLFVTVALSGPMMSEDQRQRLNPLVVKICSAKCMPSTPIPYEELQLRCQPAYVKYQLFDLPEHVSIGRAQDKEMYWNDVNVVLAGTMESSELREYLTGPPLEVQVHDRDRILEKQKLKPTLFGDDLEDEKISNVGTISSKRTVHSPFAGKDKPWDPYGVAKVDLSDLLLGQQMISLRVPIHQCVAPDVLGVREGRQDGKLIGVAGAVDGPVDVPLATGTYLQSGASLKVKVEVARPLVSPGELAAKSDMETTIECPFSRIVYKFDYKNVSFLHKLRNFITDVNAAALDLHQMPPQVIQAALSTYKLSQEQQSAGGLDLLTGFQVLDGTMHLFVLEGLRNGAVKRLWETLTKAENSDIDILYNSDLAFRSRLYGPLDVDLARIKLHEPLSVITQQPLLYVRDMVPKPCFLALVKLQELTVTAKLRDAVRNDVFPVAEMVLSMSKEFGVPMTAADVAALQPQPPGKEKAGNEPAPDLPRSSLRRRERPVIDNNNNTYMDRLQDRQKGGSGIDYDMANKSMVRERSILNSIKRSRTMPATIRVDTGSAYNYSSQTLNSTEQARESLRQLLSGTSDVRYTYCPDYHHSMTVVPVNTEALYKQATKDSKATWKTDGGWVYPGKKTMVESNVHPRRLHPARVDDLVQPWEELSRLPKGKVVDRSRYTWNKRTEDLDIWTRPHPVFGQNEPITIHLAGQKLNHEQKLAAEKEHKTWESKVIVDEPRSHFHRCGTETELKAAGFKSSNQIDRLKGLLKDPPTKYALKKPGLAIQDIPSLNVVLNPSVDSASRSQGLSTRPAVPEEFDPKIKGFVPGPYDLNGWTVDWNQIPTRDYEHQSFIREKGQDFNVYHKERSNLYKRPIVPLEDSEYRPHIFGWPKYSRDLASHYVLPDIDAYQSNPGSAPIQKESIPTS